MGTHGLPRKHPTGASWAHTAFLASTLHERAGHTRPSTQAPYRSVLGTHGLPRKHPTGACWAHTAFLAKQILQSAH